MWEGTTSPTGTGTPLSFRARSACVVGGGRRRCAQSSSLSSPNSQVTGSGAPRSMRLMRSVVGSCGSGCDEQAAAAPWLVELADVVAVLVEERVDVELLVDLGA